MIFLIGNTIKAILQKFRPIAAGQIAVKNAIAFGFILLSIGFVIIAFYKSELIFLFALYVVLNIGYSIKVKNRSNN